MLGSPFLLVTAPARGFTPGEPDRDLLQSLRHLSPKDVSQAFLLGASPMVRDRQGRSPFHVMYDTWEEGNGSFSPNAILECARLLLIHRADPSETCPTTGASALERAAVLAGHPDIASQWFRMWDRCCHWNTPGHSGQALWRMWRAQATPELATMMDQRFLPSSRLRPAP